MGKDMQEAPRNIDHTPIKRLTDTGIKLSVTDKTTGKLVNYGVQLNNTTLEIEALPNLKVEVSGYSDLYEACIAGLAAWASWKDVLCSNMPKEMWQETADKLGQALAKAKEGK